MSRVPFLGDEDGQAWRCPMELLVEFERGDAARAFADAAEAVPRHRYRVTSIQDFEEAGDAWSTVVVETQGDDYDTAEEALRPLAEKYSGEVGH